MWTGLTSPKSITCGTAESCKTLGLAWLSDGSNYDHVPAQLKEIKIWEEDHFCVRHKKSQKADSADCVATTAPFACEYTCDGIRGGKNVYLVPVPVGKMSRLHMNGLKTVESNKLEMFHFIARPFAPLLESRD